ncbi:MAG: sugar phosphate isomerase/epimerase [Bryobacteraceae bacterium]
MFRRTLLAGLPAAAVVRAARFSKPLGLSLYTVRGPLAKDPAKTYRDIAAAGIVELEVRPDNLHHHASMIADAGLRPVHMFIDSSVITGGWDEWRTFMSANAARLKMAPPADAPKPSLAEMLELASKHKVRRIGLSYLLPGERKVAVERINAAIPQCAAAGIELYYHNHAFEFGGKPGERMIDTLLAELDPRVRLELDVFWATVGGEDPAALIRRAKGRVASLHLKDAAPGVKPGATEFAVPPSAFKEVGAGTIDWFTVLKAANEARVDHYLIEQDHTPGDPIDSIRKSIHFLRS